LPASCNVFDTLNTSNNPLVSLPNGLIEDHKQHALRIGAREAEAAKNLKIPGKNRFLMPEVP